MLTTFLAKSVGITDKNSLSRIFSIVRLNLTTTTGESSVKYLDLISSTVSTSYAVGGDISTGSPKSVAKAVEAAPIIWFITSQTALVLSSSI